MYAFASGVTTAMLSGIGVAIGIMVCMTVFALFHRAAMGGKQDQMNRGFGWSYVVVNISHVMASGCVLGKQLRNRHGDSVVCWTVSNLFKRD